VDLETQNREQFAQVVDCAILDIIGYDWVKQDFTSNDFRHARSVLCDHRVEEVIGQPMTMAITTFH
jgi:hypothetical protein